MAALWYVLTCFLVTIGLMMDGSTSLQSAMPSFLATVLLGPLLLIFLLSPEIASPGDIEMVTRAAFLSMIVTALLVLLLRMRSRLSQ
jgi:hypothetical protein